MNLKITQIAQGILGFVILVSANAAFAQNTFPATGNVGIGTNAPSAKLHLNDAGTNQYTVRVQSASFNTVGAWGGIGLSGEASNTKGAILFQSAGTSYSRGKIIFALNNVQDQSNASPADAVMTLMPTGNVGVGTTSPTVKLEVIGEIKASGTIAAPCVATTSDERLKTEIKSLDGMLDKILKLKGVSFNWKDKELNKTAGKQIGFIAQAVEKVFPEVVITDKQGMKAINYAALVSPVVESVKELFSKVQSHDKDIAELKEQNRILKSQLEAQTALLKAKIDEQERSHLETKLILDELRSKSRIASRETAMRK